MKKLRQWGLLLCALLLTACGALLPYAVSRMQDRYVEDRTETRSFEPVSLTLLEGGSLLLILEKMPNSFTMGWSGETNMTELDVMAAARDAVSAITDAGLIQVYAQKYPLNRDLLEQMDLERLMELCELVPMLMVSTADADFSAVVWCCFWHMGFDGRLFFDDLSGQLVSATFDIFETDHYETDRRPDTWAELSTKQAYIWQDFFAAYYDGIENVSIADMEQNSEYMMTFILLFEPGNGQDSFRVPLVFYDSGYFTFNHMI